jgi:hypothetical protein
MEALNWMDIQAMASGDLPRDGSRITATLRKPSRAPAPLNQPTICWPRSANTSPPHATFGGLADISDAKAKVAELEKARR